jgi:hypothetical protein
MKVSSPVGDFPFELQRVEVHDRKVVIRSRMGAWPSSVEVSPKDIWPLLKISVAVLGALAVALLRAASPFPARGSRIRPLTHNPSDPKAP